MNKLIENIVIDEIQSFKKRDLKAILGTQEAYDILESISGCQDCTWAAGGCAILAYALNIITGYPIYVIYNYHDNQVEHFVVKTPTGTYIDGDGEQRDLLRNFRRRDFWFPEKRLGILPYKKGLNIEDIIVDMEGSKRLAEFIKSQGMNEGVADRYAEKEFNIQDPNTKMDAIARSGIEDDETGTYIGTTEADGGVKVFMNPKSLKNFGNNTRAISDYDGNLFIAQNDGDFVHGEIARTVKKSGKFNMQDPYYHFRDLVLWHRIKSTNVFGMSDSYYGWATVNPEIANDLIGIAKHVNPQFSFQFNLWTDLLR